MSADGVKLSEEIHNYFVGRIGLAISQGLSKQGVKDYVNLNALAREVLASLDDLNYPVLGIKSWDEFIKSIEADYSHVHDFENVAKAQSMVLGIE